MSAPPVARGARVRNAPKPRPRKKATESPMDPELGELLQNVQEVEASDDKEVAVTKLYDHLCQRGSYLDNKHTEMLEDVFLKIRDWLRQPEIGPLSRTQLLQLLETRCQHWADDHFTAKYYKQKIPVMAEMQDFEPKEQIKAEIPEGIPPKAVTKGKRYQNFLIEGTPQHQRVIASAKTANGEPPSKTTTSPNVMVKLEAVSPKAVEEGQYHAASTEYSKVDKVKDSATATRSPEMTRLKIKYESIIKEKIKSEPVEKESLEKFEKLPVKTEVESEIVTKYISKESKGSKNERHESARTRLIEERGNCKDDKNVMNVIENINKVGDQVRMIHSKVPAPFLRNDRSHGEYNSENTYLETLSGSKNRLCVQKIWSQSTERGKDFDMVNRAENAKDGRRNQNSFELPRKTYLSEDTSLGRLVANSPHCEKADLRNKLEKRRMEVSKLSGTGGSFQANYIDQREIDLRNYDMPNIEDSLENNSCDSEVSARYMEDTNKLFRDLVITRHFGKSNDLGHDNRMEEFPLEFDWSDTRPRSGVKARSEINFLPRAVSVKSGQSRKTAKTTKTGMSRMRMDEEEECEWRETNKIESDSSTLFSIESHKAQVLSHKKVYGFIAMVSGANISVAVESNSGDRGKEEGVVIFQVQGSLSQRDHAIRLMMEHIKENQPPVRKHRGDTKYFKPSREVKGPRTSSLSDNNIPEPVLKTGVDSEDKSKPFGNLTLVSDKAKQQTSRRDILSRDGRREGSVKGFSTETLALALGRLLAAHIRNEAGCFKAVVDFGSAAICGLMEKHSKSLEKETDTRIVTGVAEKPAQELSSQPVHCGSNILIQGPSEESIQRCMELMKSLIEEQDICSDGREDFNNNETKPESCLYQTSHINRSEENKSSQLFMNASSMPPNKDGEKSCKLSPIHGPTYQYKSTEPQSCVPSTAGGMAGDKISRSVPTTALSPTIAIISPTSLTPPSPGIRTPKGRGRRRQQEPRSPGETPVRRNSLICQIDFAATVTSPEGKVTSPTVTSPKTGVAQSAATVTSPRTGIAQTAAIVTSPKTGIAQTAAIVTSPQTGIAQTAALVTSPRTGVAQTAATVVHRGQKVDLKIECSNPDVHQELIKVLNQHLHLLQIEDQTPTQHCRDNKDTTTRPDTGGSALDTTIGQQRGVGEEEVYQLVEGGVHLSKSEIQDRAMNDRDLAQGERHFTPVRGRALVGYEDLDWDDQTEVSSPPAWGKKQHEKISVAEYTEDQTQPRSHSTVCESLDTTPGPHGAPRSGPVTLVSSQTASSSAQTTPGLGHGNSSVAQNAAARLLSLSSEDKPPKSSQVKDNVATTAKIDRPPQVGELVKTNDLRSEKRNDVIRIDVCADEHPLEDNDSWGDEDEACLRSELGDEEGACLRSELGDEEGVGLRSELGDEEGACLRSELREGDEACLRSELGDEEGAGLRSELGDEEGACLRSELREGDEACLRSELGEKKGAGLRSELGEGEGAGLRSELGEENQMKEIVYSFTDLTLEAEARETHRRRSAKLSSTRSSPGGIPIVNLLSHSSMSMDATSGTSDCSETTLDEFNKAYLPSILEHSDLPSSVLEHSSLDLGNLSRADISMVMPEDGSKIRERHIKWPQNKCSTPMVPAGRTSLDREESQLLDEMCLQPPPFTQRLLSVSDDGTHLDIDKPVSTNSQHGKEDDTGSTNTHQNTYRRRGRWGFLQPGNIVREPITPVTPHWEVQRIEATMPNSTLSAKTRRKMFGYTAEERHKRLRLCTRPAQLYRYSRKELISWSESEWTRNPPPEWSVNTRVFKEVCLTKPRTEKPELRKSEQRWALQVPVIEEPGRYRHRSAYEESGRDQKYMASSAWAEWEKQFKKTNPFTASQFGERPNVTGSGDAKSSKLNFRATNSSVFSDSGKDKSGLGLGSADISEARNLLTSVFMKEKTDSQQLPGQNIEEMGTASIR